MAPQILIACYCVIIVLMSSLGGHLPSLVRMSHLRTQLLISFVGGLMLGIAFLHLFPHAVSTLGSASKASAACLVGVVSMFVLLRAFHAPHTHGFAAAIPVKLAGENEVVQPCCGEVHNATLDAHSTEEADSAGYDHSHAERAAADTESPAELRRSHAHSENCGHSPHEHLDVTQRWMGWLGILFGLWLHTFIDGVALAAGTVADSQHPGMILAGLGTFLAVALHKPLDAFTITSTMRAGGWSSYHQTVVNILFSLACPAGAFLFFLGVNNGSPNPELLGWGLAISAGFFICIALADLLPEVSFHHHDRGKLSVAFFLGLLLAVAVENLPGHSHDHDAKGDSNAGYLHHAEHGHSAQDHSH